MGHWAPASNYEVQMFEYACKIENVVDGDTLDIVMDLGFNIILRERVRLLGVNTPEVFGPKACDAGKAASAFTKQWVADQQTKSGHFLYTSDKYNAREKYGRCLGRISFVSEAGVEVLNDALIAKGWAY